MCLYPKLVNNRKYVANKKNKGNIPEVKDKRVLMVPVGCGKCMECRRQKSSQWRVRLTEDIRLNTNAKFITLTFSDQSLIEIEKEIKGITGYDRDNEVCRISIRRFLERWRKKYGKSLRHWFVTELGHTGTERVHIHGIVWTDESMQEIKERWGYGIAVLGDGKGKHYVDDSTINYIVKYLNKQDKDHKEYVSKMFVSPGIGSGYVERDDCKLNKFMKGKTKQTYTTRQGNEIGLPIYWRNKIYSDEEREQLWLERLDEERRWVDGVAVSIKDGEEDYYNLLEIKRKKNRRLGYGTDEKNWELKKYENERRNLKKLERIKRKFNKGSSRGIKPPAGTLLKNKEIKVR